MKGICVIAPTSFSSSLCQLARMLQIETVCVGGTCFSLILWCLTAIWKLLQKSIANVTHDLDACQTHSFLEFDTPYPKDLLFKQLSNMPILWTLMGFFVRELQNLTAELWAIFKNASRGQKLAVHGKDLIFTPLNIWESLKCSFWQWGTLSYFSKDCGMLSPDPPPPRFVVPSSSFLAFQGTVQDQAPSTYHSPQEAPAAPCEGPKPIPLQEFPTILTPSIFLLGEKKQKQNNCCYSQPQGAMAVEEALQRCVLLQQWVVDRLSTVAFSMHIVMQLCSRP